MRCAVGAVLALGIASMASGAGVAEPAEQAAGGVGRLAWHLVRAGGSDNVVVSPASVWETLAMTHVGARGETAAEMAQVLGMPDDRAAIAAASTSLRNLFAEARGAKIVLDTANRIWVQKDRKLEADFTRLLDERFAAGAGILDFAGQPEPSRTAINAWVSAHTATKINELLKAGTITPLTRLVLTNAVSLKAPWEKAFEKSDTWPERFILAGAPPVDVPFMHRSDQLVAGRFGAGPRAATACEIPYAGGRLAMFLIVPDDIDGLSAVLAGLDGASLPAWKRGTLRLQDVNLALPTWTARKPLGLDEALASMGMKRAFQQGVADFSGIDGTRELFVSSVVHEGFVEVAEEGTEAAAATATIADLPGPPPAATKPLEVRADRPFAWAVVERASGTILFAGVVADPR